MKLFEDYRPRKQRDSEAKPSMSQDIRPAGQEDIKQLATLTYNRDGGDLAQLESKFKNEIANMESTDDGLLLVAELNSEVIGFARVKYFKPAPASPANICPEGWYLTGIIVAPEYRRRGMASALTQARLDWIAQRADQAYYFANAKNRVSIELHERFGFVEFTRDFVYPDVTFTGGEGILFSVKLA